MKHSHFRSNFIRILLIPEILGRVIISEIRCIPRVKRPRGDGERSRLTVERREGERIGYQSMYEELERCIVALFGVVQMNEEEDVRPDVMAYLGAQT